MEYIKSTLPSGLRFLTIPMPSLESATVTVWAGVGSRYETDKISGISHFLEHMVFKGGVKYPSAQAVSSAIDAIGAEFNAGTGKEYTNFYIKAQKGQIEKAFDVLSDMVISPALKSEDLERERGVIIEEMNMYEDTPIYRIGDIYEQVAFSGSPLGRDIIGTKEAVKSVSQSDFREYMDHYYRASNIVVTVAGGVTHEEVTMLVEKYFSKLRNEHYERKFVPFVRDENRHIKTVEKKIEQAHMMLGFKGRKLGDDTQYTEEILSTLLGSGMSSRLFTEVREKRGLAYSVRTSPDNYLDTGAFSTYAGVDPKKAIEALKVMLSEHTRIISEGVNGISDEELTKAKEYVKGHLALSLEDTRAVGSYFGGDELLLGKVEKPEDEMEKLSSVTKEEIISLAKNTFTRENLYLALIGPFSDDSIFEKEIDLSFA